MQALIEQPTGNAPPQPRADAFFQAAMLAALNGVMANPAYVLMEPTEVLNRAQAVAELADYRLKKLSPEKG